MQNEILKEKIYRCFNDQKLKDKTAKIIGNGAIAMFVLVVIGIVFLILLTFFHGTVKLVFTILGASFSVGGILTSLISSLVATRTIKKNVTQQYKNNTIKYYEFVNESFDDTGIIWKNNSIQIKKGNSIVNIEISDDKNQITINFNGNKKTIDNHELKLFAHPLKWSDKLIVWSKNTYYNTSVEFVANLITEFVTNDLKYIFQETNLCA